MVNNWGCFSIESRFQLDKVVINSTLLHPIKVSKSSVLIKLIDVSLKYEGSSMEHFESRFHKLWLSHFPPLPYSTNLHYIMKGPSRGIGETFKDETLNQVLFL